MKKTKIICTIGPSVNTEEMITGLISNGMDCARFNFSHGTHESQKEMIDLVKKASLNSDKAVAILLDTKGPEIRLKDFVNGSVVLKKGQTFILDTNETLLGDENRIGLSYHELAKTLKPGTQILIDDGKIDMTLTEVKDDSLICKVVVGGKVSNHKSINIPNVAIPMPFLSEADKSDLLFGISQGVDFVAASFVRTKEDVIDLKKFLAANGGEKIEVISKIENIQGVNNFDEILQVTDGIMVARGDLGVEIPFKDIPALQKSMIHKCNKYGKLVVVATQMLESMTSSPRPTRAEVSDVANAVFDGTVDIMLSGESASGLYPLKAVETMSDIAQSAESSFSAVSSFENVYDIPQGISEAICRSAYDASNYIHAKAIIVVTRSGRSAKQISSFKPTCPIIAVALSPRGKRQLALYYNTFPVQADEKNSFNELISYGKEKALATGLVQKDDKVVIVIGSLQEEGYTDTVRISTL
ncbi:MAG: pyruvate kinase [Bacilli bacterium]